MSAGNYSQESYAAKRLGICSSHICVQLHTACAATPSANLSCSVAISTTPFCLAHVFLDSPIKCAHDRTSPYLQHIDRHLMPHLMLLHPDPLGHRPLVTLEPAVWVSIGAHGAACMQTLQLLAHTIRPQVPKQQAVSLTRLDSNTLLAAFCGSWQSRADNARQQRVNSYL
jgi:hypothetical protein